MKTPTFRKGLAGSILMTTAVGVAVAAPKTPDIRLVTLDPGHFHAALIHRETYPDVDKQVQIYAPVGTDLVDHLKRVARFNARAEAPTDWRLEVHSGPNFLKRFTKEKAGNVAVISGRNRGKIDYVSAAVGAGYHALVDKPWILQSSEVPKLKQTLDLAEKQGRIAFDMMTERFEVTTLLQKALVNDPDVFGQIEPGTPERPSVYMESVHHLMKVVSGVPNLRPAWFFDTAQLGEGGNDVGTHLVDLVPFTLWPGVGLDVDKDVKVLVGQRWPTMISRADFERVTGEKDFPPYLAPAVKAGSLEYFCNTLITYALRGVHVKLNIIWDWEAAKGAGDSHFAFYQGSRARIEVRQGKADAYRSEAYVVPKNAADKSAILAAAQKRLAQMQTQFPGVSVEDRGAELHVSVPAALRTTHEQHFAEVARTFFGYLKAPKTYPRWEKAHMVAKYFVTTKGSEMARQAPVQVAPRIAK